MTQDQLFRKFQLTRKHTETICQHLETEDYVVQPITDVSPPKWHLAHTTWFFEQFVLTEHLPGYKEFHPDYAFLFNSYYNHMGKRILRQDRGFMTRPGVQKVLEFRQHVTRAVLRLLSAPVAPEVLSLIEIGIQHEQQHQELLAYDIKYILGAQPTFPALGELFQTDAVEPEQQWIAIDEGLYNIGATGEGFCFDNELPRHPYYLQPFSISNRLVSNGEYLEFMQDGAYQKFDYWLDEGWAFIQQHQITRPLYWHQRDGQWHHYTCSGLKPLPLNHPVSHISLYEAYAFAEWKGMRLPTEFEWEAACSQFSWGQLWEWTHSAYLPYPGFQKAKGALGEYNGKFMINQTVLRGASVATPQGHERASYRNFFHAPARWIFAGIRLINPNI